MHSCQANRLYRWRKLSCHPRLGGLHAGNVVFFFWGILVWWFFRPLTLGLSQCWVSVVPRRSRGYQVLWENVYEGILGWWHVWSLSWDCLSRPPAYIHISKMVKSLKPGISFWSRMAISNALAWLIFCSRILSDPAFASMSASRASLAMPRMNWSLIYMWDRSWWQFRHIKLQSRAPDRSRTK